MKERFKQDISLPPKQALESFSKAINDRCIANDIWRRWHCEVDGHRFQIYLWAGLNSFAGLSGVPKIVVAQGEVLQKESGSEIVSEFHWDSLIRHFL